MNTAPIPDVHLNVEDRLMRCLSRASYEISVQGKKCLLCPYRSFTEPRYLKKYLKYHCKKDMYMADPRSPQLYVIRAYFDYCQAVSPFGKKDKITTLNLLQHSASIIAK